MHQACFWGGFFVVVLFVLGFFFSSTEPQTLVQTLIPVPELFSKCCKILPNSYILAFCANKSISIESFVTASHDVLYGAIWKTRPPTTTYFQDIAYTSLLPLRPIPWHVAESTATVLLPLNPPAFPSNHIHTPHLPCTRCYLPLSFFVFITSHIISNNFMQTSRLCKSVR